MSAPDHHRHQGPWSGTPVRIITSRAPIRICDNGGWTDTWFAGHGQVFNIAVSPFVHVRAEVHPNDGRADRVLIEARSYAECFTRRPEDSRWTRHPLLEATLMRMGVPQEVALRLTIASSAPAGASTGTSAAVTVALVAALAAVNGESVDRAAVAALAHSVETETLAWQAGVQDQLAAAYGGINFIEVAYPASTVNHLAVSPEIRDELNRRLALIYLGRSHRSSDVHLEVIRQLQGRGPDCRELEDLRAAAAGARDAVLAGEVEQLGRAMAANTEAQSRLHPDLVGADALAVINTARRHGASGWKVNGAGGSGGSVTVLAPADPAAGARMLAAIEALAARFRIIPIALDADGLCVEG